MSEIEMLGVIAPVGWLITVLATYALVAIPLVFWGLGRTGKRNLAWVALPILVAVATAGLWLYVHEQGIR